MDLEDETVMNEEEWDLFIVDDATDKFKAIGVTEENEYPSSFGTLRKEGLSAKQPILDSKPAFVIAGMRSTD